MKKILYAVAMIPFLLICCNDKNQTEEDVNSGTLTFTLEMADLVLEETDGTRQAAGVDYSDFLLTLEGLSNLTIGPTKFPSDGKIQNVPSGVYNVLIKSQDAMPDPGFENPFYYGYTVTTVYPGKTQNVFINCYQLNSGLYFVFHESLALENLQDVVPVLTSDSGTLRFEGVNRESTGYFPPGEVTLQIYNGSEQVLIGGRESQTWEISPNELWKLTLATEAEDETRAGGAGNLKMYFTKIR